MELKTKMICYAKRRAVVWRCRVPAVVGESLECYSARLAEIDALTPDHSRLYQELLDSPDADEMFGHYATGFDEEVKRAYRFGEVVTEVQAMLQ